MAALTFRKSERLYQKKKIKELFTGGSSFYLYPFKVIFLKDEDLANNQVLISVPKRNFKKAVHRNLLKRRIREAYRLNKALFKIPDKLRIAYIYTSKELLEFNVIEKKLNQATERLNMKFAKKES